MRMDPFLGRPAIHTGIDLRGETGEPVSRNRGRHVTIAGREGGYGKMVEVITATASQRATDICRRST